MIELIILALISLAYAISSTVVLVFVMRSHGAQRVEWNEERLSLRTEFFRKEKDLLDRLMAKTFTDYTLIRRADEASSGPPRPFVISEEDELRYAEQMGLIPFSPEGSS